MCCCLFWFCYVNVFSVDVFCCWIDVLYGVFWFSGWLWIVEFWLFFGFVCLCVVVFLFFCLLVCGCLFFFSFILSCFWECFFVVLIVLLLLCCVFVCCFVVLGFVVLFFVLLLSRFFWCSWCYYLYVFVIVFDIWCLF